MKYPYEKGLGPDAIEKWCKELDRRAKIPLTKEEVEVLCTCHEKEKEFASDPKFKELLSGYNAVAILHNRIKVCHTYTIENAALLFLSYGIDRPGICTQYANYIQYKCHLSGIKHVDMTALCSKIIPGGLFSKETLHEMWEKQKCISNNGCLKNMLDNINFMESIKDIVRNDD